MLIKKDSLKNEVKTSKNSKFTDQPSPTPQSSLATPPKQTKSYAPAQINSPTHSYDHTDKKNQKTRITVRYNAGFGNELYIRGKGANLNWEKGCPLKNVKADEWCWETDANFSQCEFKILINDKQYESGQNHQLTSGISVTHTPHF